MIHVCFSLHDETGNYSKFLGTAILSLFDNLNPSSRSITVHILHDNTLTADNRDKFSYLAGRYNQRVKFYNVEEIFTDKIAEINNFFPKATNKRFNSAMFYRLFIPKLLPDEKKAIYLDADIIVNLDITELWQTDLENHPLAVVLESEDGAIPARYSKLVIEGFVKGENYFNSGVLLMNLEVLREEEENINAGIKFKSKHPEWWLYDQEVLNYCFETRTFALPLKFNNMIKERRKQGNFFVGEEIYHYAGGDAGLGVDMSDPFNRLWWSYFIKTPWFDIDTLSKIFQAVDELDVARENSIWKISSDTAGKVRAFVVDEENADRLEKHFSVRDEEEIFIIDPEVEESFLELIDSMDAAKDKKIFFIGIPDFAPKLKRNGFIGGKDFIDVSDFYSPAWMIRANSYNLIATL
ncbi:MAG: glycosyltransferase family 8 protein [Selenomonadaceae bacterium]|nr:glycosyltransferase family 8 protein [Selenomonadaceae bacterium]